MVRLPIPQRLSTHLSSRSPTPGQSRTPSPSRAPAEKPLVLRIAVLKVRHTQREREREKERELVALMGAGEADIIRYRGEILRQKIAMG